MRTRSLIYASKFSDKTQPTRKFNSAYSDILSIHLYIPLNLGRSFGFLILYTVRRTPWTGDQPIARPIPTQIQNKRTQDIHASSGIRTHDPSVRAGEDGSCLKACPHYSCSCSCDSLCSRVMWTI
jgi:hypothetical protein